MMRCCSVLATKLRASVRAMSLQRVAVGQMTSTKNVEENFEACARLASAAEAAGCSLLSLPECCTFIGEKDTDALAVAEPLLVDGKPGALVARFGALAAKYKLWLSLGGVPEASSEAGARYNTHIVISSAGALAVSCACLACLSAQLAHCYTDRKVHLFDLDIPGKVTLRESACSPLLLALSSCH